MRKDRFVLDANVWVSYLIGRQEETLLGIIAEHRIAIFCCEELLTEIRKVLAYPHLAKYGVSRKYAMRFISDNTIWYVIRQPIKRYIPSDRDDDYAVALALQTNSGFITSGDRHILQEKARLEEKFKRLSILTKAEFEDMFK
jgi:uncharacterized protein